MRIDFVVADLWAAESVDDPPQLFVTVISDALPGGELRITPRVADGGGRVGFDSYTMEIILSGEGDRRQARAKLVFADVAGGYVGPLLDGKFSDAEVVLDVALRSAPADVLHSQRFDVAGVEAAGGRLALDLVAPGRLGDSAVRVRFDDRVVPAATKSHA